MNHLESAQAGVAPRLSAGWEAIQEVLDDGDPHGREELRTATYQRGNLTLRTVENLLSDAVRAGLLVGQGRGAERMWQLP